MDLGTLWLTGRPFPKEAAILSPTLVHEGKWLMFHVPVKQENSDARTAKERMQEGARVCSVRFTNTDSFAVCTVLDEGSRQMAVKNCRGGNAYRHHCRALLKKVETSRAFTDKDNVSQPNRKYYMHLKHLNEHYAHQVSKEIMDFCKENQTGILVLPEYDEDFSRISMYRSGNYSPLHLSIRIRNYLKYKAWAEGSWYLSCAPAEQKSNVPSAEPPEKNRAAYSSARTAIRSTAS